ncbi:nitroreductase family deazaflavin-dependent oxidoreductase [Actinokineospora sp.]|uniref:nitroreductase family deazaflavin-dependent oxidoreductase n=1 Tax=Actinokineospora sp. TaxID=1872133 RepID=UPI0040384DEE
MTEIAHSPTDWVAHHTARYLASDGADGHLFNGYPTLLLTTLGRRSGVRRCTPLIYGRSGEDYLLVASNGGAAAHPAWYLNLLAEPRVGVQVLGDVFTARAVTAEQAAKPALWAEMVRVFPTYASYQRKADREIPVVVLTRSANSSR